MAEINAKDVFDILLESLKIQAEKYKSIVNQDLTHEQRKDFDSEIKQMFELLTSMTNSSTVYTLSEIQALKLQYEVKIQELQTTLDNIDVTTVKGQNGLSAYELASQNGFQGTESEYLESLKGQDGNDLTFEMLTSEQKESLKGQNGLSAYELASQNGFQGTEAEYLESLKGQDGKDFTFDMFTPEQLQQIANLVSVQTVDLTSILDRLKALEDGTPPISEVTFVDASLSTTDNIEENGTRILTNYLVSLDDIITVEYNVNGNILTHVLKAVSSEGVIYFEEISKDTSSLYDIATGFDFSLSGNLILSTQIYNKSDYSRYAGSYDVNVNISFSNPKAVTLEFLEVTQNSDIFYSWVE